MPFELFSKIKSIKNFSKTRLHTRILLQPTTDDFKRQNTVTGCTLARLTPLSVNSDAREYFDKSNQLIQREQLGAMNFIIFTLFYRLNHR